VSLLTPSRAGGDPEIRVQAPCRRVGSAQVLDRKVFQRRSRRDCG
jgi:hypothetical protein